MGNSLSINKINFEDIQTILNEKSTLLINTLNTNKQKCLIKNTLTASCEVETLNTYLKNGKSQIRIIIYGENALDDSVIVKYKQLYSLGFSNIYIYAGGIFEWLLLQDIYGNDLFPTTIIERDILQFKGTKKIGIQLITDIDE